MQTYKDFKPTCFDDNIPFNDSRDNWLIVPVSQTRDSGNLEKSNFESAIEQLGGESNNVEIHRYGHWGPGWFEIIIVKPDTEQAQIAADIESSLENYPVLDEEDYSQKQFDDYCESWDNCYNSDFIAGLVNKFDLSEDFESYLEDLESDELRQFYEDLVDNIYEEDSGGVYCFVDHAIDNCTENMIVSHHIFDEYIAKLKNDVFSRSLLTGKPDIFDESLRPYWDDKITIESISELENLLI